MALDMSSEAITARFRKVDELRRLCLSLAKAGMVDAPGTRKANNPSPTEPSPGGSAQGDAPGPSES